MARTGYRPRSFLRASALPYLSSAMSSRKLIRRQSPIHGYGVFAARDLRAGERLVQYRGTLRRHAEVDALPDDEERKGHTFLFTLNQHYVIDAAVRGNIARFINHGCAPNCEAVIEEAEDGDPAGDRIFIETKRKVRKGEELTYSYGIVPGEPVTPQLEALWACHCGSPRCRGTMLKVSRRKRPGRAAPARKPAPRGGSAVPVERLRAAASSGGASYP